jgi:hypothetical protein
MASSCACIAAAILFILTEIVHRDQVLPEQRGLKFGPLKIWSYRRHLSPSSHACTRRLGTPWLFGPAATHRPDVCACGGRDARRHAHEGRRRTDFRWFVLLTEDCTAAHQESFDDRAIDQNAHIELLFSLEHRDLGVSRSYSSTTTAAAAACGFVHLPQAFPIKYTPLPVRYGIIIYTLSILQGNACLPEF